LIAIVNELGDISPELWLNLLVITAAVRKKTNVFSKEIQWRHYDFLPSSVYEDEKQRNAPSLG
jgi:hypothetical protein